MVGGKRQLPSTATPQVRSIPSRVARLLGRRPRQSYEGQCSAQVVQYCMEMKIGFTIENPSRSLLWWMPEMEALTSSKTNCFRHLSACMWGSNRNKRTALFTNIPAMASMATDCDNTHEHLPWASASAKADGLSLLHKNVSTPQNCAWE